MFLEAYIDKLIEVGFHYRIQIQIGKPHHSVFRNLFSRAKFWAYNWALNSECCIYLEIMAMPHLDTEMEDLAGIKCFASTNYCQGYWKFPMDPDSYDACGIIRTHWVHSPIRVLQRSTNAAAHFQPSIEPFFPELTSNVRAWLDDFNLHAFCETELPSLLEKFFARWKDKKLILSSKKCRFSPNVYCGVEGLLS